MEVEIEDQTEGQAEREGQAIAKPNQTLTKSQAVYPSKTEGGQTSEEPGESGQQQQEVERAGNKDENGTITEQIPEESIFIPLGWPRKCPRTYYKGSDPEWQSFLEFNKDRKRSMRIRST